MTADDTVHALDDVLALADVLSEHIYDYGGYECSCGQDGLDRQDAKRHQARAVLDSGLVVPAAPMRAEADLAAARQQLDQVRAIAGGSILIPPPALLAILDAMPADETGGA